MKVVKHPPAPEDAKSNEMKMLLRQFAGWKTTVTHNKDMHGSGCGAKLEITLEDLNLLYYHGMFCGRGYYAAVKCPACNQFVVVNHKTPEKLWRLMTLIKHESFGGLAEER
ncbi:TPA: hypothetical protein DF272_00455 [Candidatus Falkowbacteria bacterium]|nr:hypothetical protein [Candidatus Falkowbacteria bacterium]